MNPKKTFLGKQGKIFGPFSQEEMNRLYETGQIEQYRWIWDAQYSHWTPLDEPPPPINDLEPNELSSVSQKAPPAFSPQKSNAAQLRTKHLEAICHNFRAAISGDLDQINETGCRLTSRDHSTTPTLPNRAKVLLNLLDPKTGKTMNVQAKIQSVSKETKGWSYRLSWSSCPAL